MPVSQAPAAGLISTGLKNSAKDDAAHFFQSAFSMDMLASAIGNVIRSKFWPAGTSALAFAGATLLTSSMLVLCMAPLFEDPRTWEFSLPILWGWIALMIAISAISYVLNFQLQKVAGPVVFSQIGYWGTGFSVLLAALLFGDILTALSLIGLAAIICGGVITRHAVGGGYKPPK